LGIFVFGYIESVPQPKVLEMDQSKFPFSSENVAQDVVSMSGKSGQERKEMADKASHKLSVAFSHCTKDEFRDYYNDVALKSRIDADKSQKV